MKIGSGGLFRLRLLGNAALAAIGESFLSNKALEAYAKREGTKARVPVPAQTHGPGRHVAPMPRKIDAARQERLREQREAEFALTFGGRLSRRSVKGELLQWRSGANLEMLCHRVARRTWPNRPSPGVMRLPEAA